MFDHFELRNIQLPQGHLRLRIGGNGFPLLLLHGHPRTHMTWGRVADLLSHHFTIVCPDLPGFGGSYIPEDSCDSRNSSKRAKADVLVHLMNCLGFGSFAVVGHDRGSR